ncbi:hypothetical protein AB1Y20_005598 [Prymnesium parvum]|uniref:Uncharacterized protein n=1 Tax=Prymnesium parvum TaxID=97485 RepID=A0AB34J6H5_PRYPA
MVADKQCFPRALDTLLPNATDPLRGISVSRMRVPHLTPLWMLLWSLLSLKEVVRVLDFGIGARDATTIGLARALQISYEPKVYGPQVKIHRPNCGFVKKKFCCSSFLVTLERDAQAMQRARQAVVALRLPHILPISPDQLNTGSRSVPVEIQSTLTSVASKRRTRDARLAAERACKRFHPNLVIVDAQVITAAQLQQVALECRPLFVVLHSMPLFRNATSPPPASPIFSTMKSSSLYELFLSRPGTKTMRPQCELIACVPDASLDNWAVFKRADGTYNGGRHSVRDLRHLHFRQIAKNMLLQPNLIVPVLPPQLKRAPNAVQHRHAFQGKAKSARGSFGLSGRTFWVGLAGSIALLCALTALAKHQYLPQIITLP